MSDTCVIFLHIPKAAGWTIYSILHRQYDRAGIFTVNGGNVVKSTNDFLSLRPEERSRFRLLMGHMIFGMHGSLPQGGRYFTLLREPVDRVISHFHYRLQAKLLEDYGMIRNMRLEDFAVLNDNVQTRVLSGVPEANPFAGNGPCTAYHLKLAKRNLKEHFAVGLIERFDESLVLFRSVFDWTEPFYVSRNVGRTRPKSDSVPQSVLGKIRARNRLDEELYSYATSLFEDAVKSYGPSFDGDVEAFRAGLATFRKRDHGDPEMYEPLYGEKEGDAGPVSLIQSLERLKEDLKYKLMVKFRLLKRSRLVEPVIRRVQGIPGE